MDLSDDQCSKDEATCPSMSSSTCEQFSELGPADFSIFSPHSQSSGPGRMSISINTPAEEHSPANTNTHTG
ncbi:hypothetical protein KIN20_028902 [Parelaphostrongylus tenuis]|uniref:Uncharacterized protein n=1 Tax=Parelaphostrongylus tenuis TaxID=148309 RepID=A0AAD5WFF6_PARTN|nr:hypothetical protein KIN20_028902 [Parelaphostrongylus tenuis]